MNKLQAPCLLSYKGVELATLYNMKRIQLYLMLSLSICGFSQEVNSRVQQIRQMYAEANTQFEANRDRCDVVTEPYVEDLGNGPYETTHSFRYCLLEQGYGVIEANYAYYEGEAKSVFYLKDGRLFFVFVYSASESCEREERFYFSTTEQSIRYLLRSNECIGENAMGSNREVAERGKRVESLMQEYRKIRPYFFSD